MSGLSYLCGYGYGSNSDDSDCEIGVPQIKRSKLPTPDLTKIPVVHVEAHEDDPEQHAGRIRSFPHVRGNWATFVYVKLPEEYLQKLVNKLQQEVFSIDKSCHQSEDFHISLSRTVVLQYHQITPFTSCIHTCLTDIKRFNLTLDFVDVYCNEENTRTFVALKVNQYSNIYLSNITKKIDDILMDFNLPTFYKDPSFHVSILWMNGNRTKELRKILEKLNDILRQDIQNTSQAFLIQQVCCRSGNKYFQYSLK